MQRGSDIVGPILQAGGLCLPFTQNWVRPGHLPTQRRTQNWVRSCAVQQIDAASQNRVRRRNWYGTRQERLEPAQRRNGYVLGLLARRIGYASAGRTPRRAPISAGITRLFTALSSKEAAARAGLRRIGYAFGPSRCGKACGISELSPQNPVRCFR